MRKGQRKCKGCEKVWVNPILTKDRIIPRHFCADCELRISNVKIVERFVKSGVKGNGIS